MLTHFTECCNQYFDDLNDIIKKAGSLRNKAESIIILTTQCLPDLKALVLKHGFSDQSEEIQFFKSIKPRIFSQLIYHSKIKEVEITLPFLGYIKDKERFLANELRVVGAFFQRNADFCNYIRSDQTFMDDKYFVRGRSDVSLFDESFMSITDTDFATCGDYKAACLLAFDLLGHYLNKKIENLRNNTEEPFVIEESTPKLRWTGSKVALVELIYALQANGCINHGHAGIKDIKETFERMFDIELGDCYRHFLEIKGRSQIDKFLSQLSESLNNKAID
jgi:hypothetical protein